jgi:hypothetical protein
LEKNFKNFIISSVKKEEKSISRLARELERDGYKMHRLYLAGYLKALADLGILKEKEIPPSKVYTTSATLDKTIYEIIGDKCKNLKLPVATKTNVAAFILQRLFRRPIFLSEINMCGFDGAIVGTRPPTDMRNDIRNKLLKSGLRIPNDDPAYILEDAYENEFERIISTIVLEDYGATPLIVDTRQTRLEDAARSKRTKAQKSRTSGSKKRKR